MAPTRWTKLPLAVASRGGLAALLLTAACSGTALPVGVDDLALPPDLRTSPLPDAAVVGDLAQASPDLAGFCGDPRSPRIELNGMLASSPFVSTAPLFLNCCEAGVQQFISMQIATSIALVWRHQVGRGPNPPLTLDLERLPDGWSVSVLSGCSPAEPNCQPSDRYESGLRGSLTIDGPPDKYRMSACVTVAEPGGQPHPVIHSLRLFSPR